MRRIDRAAIRRDANRRENVRLFFLLKFLGDAKYSKMERRIVATRNVARHVAKDGPLGPKSDGPLGVPSVAFLWFTE